MAIFWYSLLPSWLVIILYLGVPAVCQPDAVANLVNKHKHGHKNQRFLYV